MTGGGKRQRKSKRKSRRKRGRMREKKAAREKVKPRRSYCSEASASST